MWKSGGGGFCCNPNLAYGSIYEVALARVEHDPCTYFERRWKSSRGPWLDLPTGHPKKCVPILTMRSSVAPPASMKSLTTCGACRRLRVSGGRCGIVQARHGQSAGLACLAFLYLALPSPLDSCAEAMISEAFSRSAWSCESSHCLRFMED